MENNFEYIIEDHNGKYYINFKPDTNQQELDNFVKELNHLLKGFDAKAMSVGDRIELHLNSEKLQEQMHIVNKFIKEQNNK